MEPKTAKEILRHMSMETVTSRCLKRDIVGLPQVKAYNGLAKLDGNFTTGEIEAIATWMRDPEGVVKA